METTPTAEDKMVPPAALNLPSGMIAIACGNCGTRYRVAVAEIPPEGRRVKCVHCQTVWTYHHTAEPVAAKSVADRSPTVDPPDKARAGPPPLEPVSPADDRFSIWFWRVFFILAILVVAAAVFTFAGEIATVIPPLQPWLHGYVEWITRGVDSVRQWFGMTPL